MYDYETYDIRNHVTRLVKKKTHVGTCAYFFQIIIIAHNVWCQHAMALKFYAYIKQLISFIK